MAKTAVQGMSDEEVTSRVLEIVRTLRAESRWALEQWLRLLDVEGVPGCLVSEKPLRPGDPVDLHFLGNLTIDTRNRFQRTQKSR